MCWLRYWFLRRACRWVRSWASAFRLRGPFRGWRRWGFGCMLRLVMAEGLWSAWRVGVGRASAAGEGNNFGDHHSAWSVCHRLESETVFALVVGSGIGYIDALNVCGRCESWGGSDLAIYCGMDLSSFVPFDHLHDFWNDALYGGLTWNLPLAFCFCFFCVSSVFFPPYLF